MPNKLDIETFIKRSREKHGDLYDYSLSIYKNRITPIAIICKTHGIFFQRAEVHSNGHGCPACAGNEKLNTHTFIEKAVKIHGDKYDYKRVTYINSLHPVEILCNKHSIFKQKPSLHLSGQGCPNCAGNKRKNSSDFTQKANIVHDRFYGYSKVRYVNRKTNVTITCPIHGDFEQNPGAHLLGSGCPQCAGVKRHNTIDFVTKSSDVHNNFYHYDQSVYSNNRCLITVNCPVHGDFEQIARDHLRGSGCPLCGIVWRRTNFVNSVKRLGAGTLYVVRIFNDFESFYKIGITSRSISKRMKSLPYEYELIHDFVSNDGGMVYDLEIFLHNRFKENRYKPNTRFDGSTECFTRIDIDAVLQTINQFKENYYEDRE